MGGEGRGGEGRGREGKVGEGRGGGSYFTIPFLFTVMLC